MPEFEPRTRNEALLNAIAENTGGGTGSVDFESRTRNEYLLNEIRKNTEGGSGLPDVTAADFGTVLKVTDAGAWGKGNNIHWLEGGSTYLPYTQTFLNAVTGAIPVISRQTRKCLSRTERTPELCLSNSTTLLMERIADVEIKRNHD